MTGPAPDLSAFGMTEQEVIDAFDYLTSDELAMLDRLHSTANFVGYEAFLRQHDPAFKWFEATKRVGRVMDRVMSGELTRVMISWPPRLGKTSAITLRLPAVMLHRDPFKMNATISYSDNSAYGMSRRTKRLFKSYGGAVAYGSDAVSNWETPEGGGLWAAGAGGAILGKGVNGVMCIDDPIKNLKQANSRGFRDNLYEWYQGVAYTRLEQGSALVVTQQRIHDQDLIGMILKDAMKPDNDVLEPWHIVRLPALYDGITVKAPPGCTVEPDWRVMDEPLVPELADFDRLSLIRARVGPYVWATMFQQLPRQREGRMFKFPWFRYVPTRPANVAARVRYWDLAGTEDGGDNTAGCLMSRTILGSFYIEDVAKGQWGVGRREDEMEKVARRDLAQFGHGVEWWIEAETGPGGAARTRAIVLRMQRLGLSVRSDRPDKAKKLRAEPLAAAMEEDNVRLVEGAWNSEFVSEALDFTGEDSGDTHDDQVDAASAAYSKLTKDTEWDVTRYTVSA